MKKLTVLLAALALALVACGGSDAKEDTQPTEQPREIQEATSGGMERGFEDEEAVEEAPVEAGLAEEPEAAAPADAPE